MPEDEPQVQVNAVEVESDNMEGQIALGEAATTAAFLSGAAAAEAKGAEQQAQQADMKADVALASTAAVAAATPSEEEVRAIAREEVDSGMAQLATMLRQQAPPAAPVVEAQPEPAAPPDEAPKSVKKAGRKRRFSDSYFGRKADEE